MKWLSSAAIRSEAEGSASPRACRPTHRPPPEHRPPGRGQLPERFAGLGVSRTKMNDEQFRERLRPWCEKRDDFDAAAWNAFAPCIGYQPADAADLTDFREHLVPRIEALTEQEQIGENLLFYLSVAPKLYEPIIANIGVAGLVREGRQWCSLDRERRPWQRIVVEKPFGHDLRSAEHLNRVLGRVFEDESIYRIDHYLGKETVQNLLVFRFANAIWEPVWGRNDIDHVQITAAETVGVEGRGGYYESSGALRDMIQSHLLQVMAMVAMEPPNRVTADDLRSEQRKVLEAVRPIDRQAVPDAAVRGQYGAGEAGGKKIIGYRQEQDVPDDSQTDTYAAMRVFIDNWRWQGVPIYLRTGKAMRRKLTQIVITFKPTPHCLFAHADPQACPQPNRLVINVQPDEGISLRFEGKVPGEGMNIRSVVMDFDYASYFDGEPAEAYAQLLLDAMEGDRALFKDRHEIEAAWRIVEPVLGYWQANPQDDLPNYRAGTWGPDAADRLIAPHGQWRNPEGEVSRSKYL